MLGFVRLLGGQVQGADNAAHSYMRFYQPSMIGGGVASCSARVVLLLRLRFGHIPYLSGQDIVVWPMLYSLPGALLDTLPRCKTRRG